MSDTPILVMRATPEQQQRWRVLRVLAACTLVLALVPGAVYSADPSATGGGEIRFSIPGAHLDYQFSLVAVTEGDGETSGHFNYKLNRPLDLFPGGRVFLKGRVTCLQLVGESDVLLSGPTVSGKNPDGSPILPGLCWLLRVEDNGQGADAPDDAGSFVPVFDCGGVEDLICKFVPPAVLPLVGVVTKGNIQVRP